MKEVHGQTTLTFILTKETVRAFIVVLMEFATQLSIRHGDLFISEQVNE